jgi:hypothetical protein
MLIKILIVIVMLIILGALVSGLIFLIKDEGKTNRTIKALTWRILLSVSLFIFLLVAFYFHWLSPHGVG